MASVRVRAHTYRRRGKLVTVKPYIRVSKKRTALGMAMVKAGYRRSPGGSLRLNHVAARNRKGGRLPIGSMTTPRAKPYAPTATIPNLKNMSIYEIAHLIERDWRPQGKGVNFGARPYLDAMHQLSSHKDNYYMDSGSSVIRYFLSNATSWKGPKARAIKAELKRRLNT